MLDVIRANAQSWGVKIAFGIIILVFVFWGVGSFTGGPATVALTVNGEPVTIQQFQSEYELFERQLRNQMPGLDAEALKAMPVGPRVVQQLVMRELLDQEAARAGVLITPQELRRVIEEIPAFQNAEGRFDPETYLRLLKAQRDSPGRFEARLRDQLLMEKLREEITAGVFVSEAEVKDLYLYDGERRIVEYILFPIGDYASRVTVDDADVKAWYEANQGAFRVPPQADVEYLLVGAKMLAASEPVDEAAVRAAYEREPARYTRPERVRARHILLPLAQDASPEETEKVKSEIEALERRIRDNNEDFAALAGEYSRDPGSAGRGGDLGWFAREQMVKPFADAAFALEPGAMSGPVRTQFGYHLIRAEEREAESLTPLAEVHDEIRARLAAEQAAGKVQDVLEQIQAEVIGGKDLAAAGEARGLKIAGTGLKPQAELPGLLDVKPAQLAPVLAAAPGTTLDAPLVTREGYLLTRLKESRPESVKPLAEVASEIRARLEKERALQLAMKDAEEVRKTLETEVPAALRAKIAKSAPAGRDGLLPGLKEEGADPALGKALFETETGRWLPGAFALDGGAAVLRVAEVVRPSDEDWAVASKQISAAVADAKRQQMFQAFLTMLRAGANVEIRDERIMQ